MATTFFQNSSFVSRKGIGVSQPALFTRMYVPAPAAFSKDSTALTTVFPLSPLMRCTSFNVGLDSLGEQCNQSYSPG